LGGVSSNPYFSWVSFAFSNESNTPTRLIPSQASRELVFFEPQRREGREGFFVFFLIGKDQSGKRKRFWVWVL
jgi:hypothetical protein